MLPSCKETWRHKYSHIFNPLLYEPLLPSHRDSNHVDQEDIDDLIAKFTHSDEEDIELLEQILCHVSPSDQSLNDEGLTLLHIAAKKGYQRCLDILLKHGVNNWTDAQNIMCKRHGQTPLHFASMNGFENCIHTLLNAKADPTKQNFSKKTPLHYACGFGYSSCADALLNHSLGKWKIIDSRTTTDEKALINIRDDNGQTALHHAVIDGNVSTVKILLEAKANVFLLDDDHRSAMDIAKSMTSHEHAEITKLLELRNPHSTIKLPSNDTALPSTLFEGLQISPATNSPATSPSTLFEGLLINQTDSIRKNELNYLKKSSSSSPLPPDHILVEQKISIPIDRWVVLQSGMLVAEPTTGTILVHPSKYVADCFVTQTYS